MLGIPAWIFLIPGLIVLLVGIGLACFEWGWRRRGRDLHAHCDSNDCPCYLEGRADERTAHGVHRSSDLSSGDYGGPGDLAISDRSEVPAPGGRVSDNRSAGTVPVEGHTLPEHFGTDPGWAGTSEIPPVVPAAAAWEPEPDDRIAQWAGTRPVWDTSPDTLNGLDPEWFLEQAWKADEWAISAPAVIEQLAAHYYRHPELMDAKTELALVLGSVA